MSDLDSKDKIELLNDSINDRVVSISNHLKTVIELETKKKALREIHEGLSKNVKKSEWALRLMRFGGLIAVLINIVIFQIILVSSGYIDYDLVVIVLIGLNFVPIASIPLMRLIGRLASKWYKRLDLEYRLKMADYELIRNTIDELVDKHH